ncbi:MAG: osmotically inducible protein OsmC [Gammaproteobacteria bacterium]|nr:MAG: osmotically inducible protein OsmC [Gammaproteobacteria bacterium]
MQHKPTSTVTYAGNLRTEATHLQSGQAIITDAPVDNHGKGEAFSPTDLVATALASCMMTIMGIESMDVDIANSRVEVTKVMSASPRRIAEIIMTFHLPAGLDDASRKRLEAAAHTCPVAQSLHPETQQTVMFRYG